MASAASLVDKATSDLLIGPDWAMNLDICDSINGSPGQARDVVKAVKKRLNNKNPRIQLLALTVLETLIKNCGEIVHQQVAEKDVLHEMTRIVKKKSDMQVRDKILTLLDSWQEAFGGSRGRYPQYYMAYEELRVRLTSHADQDFSMVLSLSGFYCFSNQMCKLKDSSDHLLIYEARELWHCRGLFASFRVIRRWFKMEWTVP